MCISNDKRVTTVYCRVVFDIISVVSHANGVSNVWYHIFVLQNGLTSYRGVDMCCEMVCHQWCQTPLLAWHPAALNIHRRERYTYAIVI